MSITPVNLTDTFDVWRTRTNQIITLTDEITSNVSNTSNIAVAAFAKANGVGTGANAYLISVIAGANTAVGAGANAYSTSVGAGANAYLISVIAGANTAVGTGANAYSTSVGAGANAYMISVQNGSNTAIGAGANAFATSVNTYVRTIAVASFAKANSALANTSDVSFVGNLNFPSGNVGILTTSAKSGLDINGSYCVKATAAGSGTLDCRTGNYFTRTITGNETITFTNPPSTGSAFGLVLVLTNGGSATVTWGSSPKWPSGTAPTLTASGTDILVFVTNDGGTTWRGNLVQKDSR